jgi:hypothetical protein
MCDSYLSTLSHFDVSQHNGEITQGARKTTKNRPWVMQMIIHGFPSNHSALQFEWAWQALLPDHFVNSRGADC